MVYYCQPNYLFSEYVLYLTEEKEEDEEEEEKEVNCVIG
jgi:hypothetical protein